MVEKNNTPLYEQVKEAIRTAINNGKYHKNQQIPPEPALSEEYSVSRITIRRAIEELCAEGYLVKMQGKGTFVNAPRIHRKFVSGNRVESFSQTCHNQGLVPGAKLIDCRIVPAKQEESEFFSIPVDSLLIHVKRVRTADGQPIFLENIFVPYEKNKALLTADLNDNSIFETIYSITGHRPSNTKNRILEIAKASAEQSRLLNIPLAEPLFFLNVGFLDEEGNPLCIGRQYYIGSRYMFDI